MSDTMTDRLEKRIDSLLDERDSLKRQVSSRDAAMAAKDAELADLKTTLERYEFSFEHQERKNGFLNDKIQEYHEQLVWDAMQTEDTLKRKRAVESDLETAQALIAALERKVAEQASKIVALEADLLTADDELSEAKTAQDVAEQQCLINERRIGEQASELAATLETGLIERLEILNVLNPMIDKRNDEIAALKKQVADVEALEYMRAKRCLENDDEIAALKGDVAALLEAVAFYADKKNWDDRWVDPTGNPDDEGDSYDVISAVDVEWPDDKRKCPFGGLTARQASHAHTERTKAREGGK